MPLFKVSVEYEFAVESSSIEEARSRVSRYMQNMDDEPIHYHVEEISSKKDYPAGYTNTSYPYGGDGTKTMKDVLGDEA